MYQENYGVYGARKVWLALNREGIGVARCTVERLMRELGLPPGDLVKRHFSPRRLDAMWVAGFTYSAQFVVMCNWLEVRARRGDCRWRDCT